MISNEEIKSFREKFKYLEKKISEYSLIVIYRHESPDFDALGAQMGLYTWIKDNYPDKEVHFVGDTVPVLFPLLFPFPENVSQSFFDSPHLAISVDISNRNRISHLETLRFAKEVIKIDHHPLPKPEDDFGDFQIVFPDRPAAAEIIALFALSRKKKLRLSKEAASYLYTGIVGDTGRFLYQDTDSATLRIAGDLLDHGVDMTDVYNRMYETDQRRMNIQKYVLNNYHITDKGTCYFVFDKKTMKELDMTIDEGNLFINNFRNMKGVKAVCSITEDEKKGQYRVSLRSNSKHVAPVAILFDGGGHDYAAGCRLTSIDKLPLLLAELDKITD